MSDKQLTKPVNRCHNSMAGCTNTCRPGYNFCDECRKFFGMTKTPEDTAAKSTNRYQHPIIGVGDAAQTHLHGRNMNAAIKKTLNDFQTMDKDELRKEIEARKEGDIATILIETGALQPQEAMPMDEVKAVEKSKPKAVCPIHGEHDGTTIGKNYNHGLCPKCVAEKKSRNLKFHGAANEKSGIMFEGFRKKWLDKAAQDHGVSIKQLLTIWIDEKIPAEEFKAGYLEDMRGKWER